MKKYMLALGLSLLTVLGLFTGCSPKAETASDSDSLKIVATIFPEYDWVRQVLGDRAGEVQLTLLLDSGTDLHSYQPTAADMLTIGECDLFLYNGGESDAWVERVLAIALIGSMVISLVFFLAAFFCPHLLMRIFTNDPELIQLGIPYLRIVSWSYLFMGISQIYLCIMKNSGRTMRSTVYGSSAVVLNLLLNTLLIFGFLGFPRMEIVGAALATTIARAVELGRGALERAREYGGRLCRISVAAGAVSGVILLACSPLVQLLAASLSEQAHEYLRVMLLICAYYLIGKAVNSTVVAGIFCAGGDTKFGLLCDAVTMWVIIVPIGMLAAFVWKLPVLAVYFLLNLDEFVKLPAVYRHYKKYRWVRNLTKESQGQ